MPDGLLRTGTTTLQDAAIALIVGAKIAFPLLIIRFPFAAGWANFVLDGIDGDLLVPLGLDVHAYQLIDKSTDWLTYVAIVVLAYRDRWPIRRLILGLFLFRSIGQLGFLLTGNEVLLALFPNFLEPLFLVSATLLAWNRAVRHRADWRDRAFATLHRHRWVIGLLIVLYKLQDEWVTHIGNVDRTDFVRQLLSQLFGG
jgi:hypothetical protein